MSMDYESKTFEMYVAFSGNVEKNEHFQHLVIRHIPSGATIMQSPHVNLLSIKSDLLFLLDVAYKMGQSNEYNRVNQNEQDYRPGSGSAAAI